MRKLSGVRTRRSAWRLANCEQYVDRYAMKMRPGKLLSVRGAVSGKETSLELINDILDLSKIEAGQLEANLEEVDLRKTVDVCLRMTQDQAVEAGLAVGFKSVDDVPVIRSNARMLRQVILNLLSNAIKFTPGGGQINLGIELDEATGSVALLVKDTGIGIAQADIARVMRPFEQVESAQSELHRGTGLGLPMAKSLRNLSTTLRHRRFLFTDSFLLLWKWRVG